METALRRIADTLLTFVDDAVARYGGEVWWPSNWPGITWALLAVLLVLLWVASRRQRRPRGLEVRPPQLLVTNGEVVPDATGDGDLQDRPVRRRLDAVVHAASGTLAMTVSNLSRYPVQVLEVALRDEPRGAPRVVAVDAVVPAMGSVTVEGPVPLALRGDGWLDLYCYAAATRAKMHRHRVELVWEPWSARFKVAPLEQAVVAVRRLASDEPRARFLDDAVVGAAAALAQGDGVAAAAQGDGDAGGRAVVVAAVPAAVPDASDSTVPAARRAGSGPRPAAARSAPRGSEAPDRRVEPGRAGARARGSDREAPRVVAGPGRHDPDPIDASDVPRIATPPVGVAVTGRGGSAARAPGGHPIGRPRAAPDAPRGDATTGSDPTSEAPGRDPRPVEPRRTSTGGAEREVPTPEPVAPTPEPMAPAPEPVAPRPEPATPGRAASVPVRAAPEPEEPMRLPPAPPPDAIEPAPALAAPTPEPDAGEPESAAAEPDPAEPEPAEPAPEEPKPRRPRLAFPDEF